MTDAPLDRIQASWRRRLAWLSAELQALSPASACSGEPLVASSGAEGPSLSSWGTALAAAIATEAGDTATATATAQLPLPPLVGGVVAGRLLLTKPQFDQEVVSPALAMDPSVGGPQPTQPVGLQAGLGSLAGMFAAGGAGSGGPLCSCALCQAAASGGAARALIERLLSLRNAPQLPERTVALQRGSTVPGTVAAGPSGAPVAGMTTPVSASLTIADADVFRLESNPGASKTIYLNFLGASLSGTAWNPSGTSWNGVAPAFTLDSDTSTNFSAAERAAIKEIFARVACDYAPFNVNVTTKAPTSDRINRASSSDSVYGTVCLFSNISSQTGYPDAGGVAYVGVFDGVDSDVYKPALVFPSQLGNSAKNIAEAASHEIGHNLNLRHDGTSTTGYYSGQGGSPGWAPIMGVGYYRTLTQFSRGSYNGANNTENDFTQITGEGISYWLDAVGNDTASALALSLTDANADGISDRLQIGGAIELTSSDGLGLPDRDFYRFLAPSDGDVTINIRNALCYFDPAAGRYTFAPVPTGFGNLRLDARLHDASGNVLADWGNDAALDIASFSVTGLRGGQNYYVSVFANSASPDGEDTYGSLGDYILDLVYKGQPTPPPATPVPLVSITVIGGADSVVSGQVGDATVVGTAEANRSVTLLFNGTSLGTTTADGSGALSYALTAANLSTIGQGSGKTITASQSDGAGNVGTSAPFGFAVTSLAPVYSLAAPASVQEGQSLLISIGAANVEDGRVLGWRFSGSGIGSSDLVSGALSGTVTVSGGSASLTLQVTADSTLEPTETGLFELLEGTAVVSSSSIALIDTNSRWGTTGSDSITGTDNRFERLTGVASTGITNAQLGTAQRDVVTGGIGADEFLLSEVRQGAVRIFYNDNSSTNTGTLDCLQIRDFRADEDKLRFAGGRYFSRNNGSDTWIWYDRNNNGSLNTTNFQSTTDELVAILSEVNLGSATMVSSSSSNPAWVVFA